MFVDLDWPLNASSLLSASAELLVKSRLKTFFIHSGFHWTLIRPAASASEVTTVYNAIDIRLFFVAPVGTKTLRKWNNGLQRSSWRRTCFEMRPHSPSVVPRTAAGTGRWTDSLASPVMMTDQPKIKAAAAAAVVVVLVVILIVVVRQRVGGTVLYSFDIMTAVLKVVYFLNVLVIFSLAVIRSQSLQTLLK